MHRADAGQPAVKDGMRLWFEHVTTYTYERPVGFGRHRLVLRPREGPDLRLEHMDLHITPAHRLHWIRDVFGNSIAIVDGLAPSAELTIVNTLTLLRICPFPITSIHEPWLVPFPPVYDSLELPVIAMYRTLGYPDDGPPVQQWLAGALTPVEHDAESTMQALCELIFKTILYQRRTEKGVQTPAQTLSLRSGSCRDLATLMMEAARALGVAARFVSGYLHSHASMIGRGSTHAWTEVYLPALGWRGFDPTSGQPVSTGHIVTGVSNHPRGVMPVSGAFIGLRTDVRSMTVRVTSRELTA